MPSEKINLVIIFGGQSAEHEVSITSARSVMKAIDKDKYNISLIGIDKKGKWLSISEQNLLQENFALEENATKQEKNNSCSFLVSGVSDNLKNCKGSDKKIDVVFPILHGPFGEDGTIQGFLKTLGIPFIGPDVLGSAVNMDKDVSKRLFQQAGLPTAEFLVFKNKDKGKISFAKISTNLGLPFFVKPANLGSSVGISKVKNKDDFQKAIREAFLYDSKIIIEEEIRSKEIECAILGNENPKASVLGEIIPTHDFYSYDAKYLDVDGAKMSIPAKIDKQVAKKIQRMAIEAFEVLCCRGMGRVDFFLTKDNKIFVNEINTIPGFTPKSMYPKLWEVSGLGYAKLIDELIKLTLE